MEKSSQNRNKSLSLIFITVPLLVMSSALASSSSQPLDIKWVPSPNFTPGRTEAANTLVIHHTAMDSFDDALFKLTDKNDPNPVSAHYLIGKNGTIAQLVKIEDTAWHAGVSSWLGKEKLNSRSIGIETDNTGFEPFSPELMKSLKQLTQYLVEKYNIVDQKIVGHTEIAPTRKDDPSQYFDWKWMSEDDENGKGVGYFPSESGDTEKVLFKQGSKIALVATVQSLLKDIGYNVPLSGTYDDATQPVIMAFKRRYSQESFKAKVGVSVWTENDQMRLQDVHSHYFKATQQLEADGETQFLQ